MWTQLLRYITDRSTQTEFSRFSPRPPLISTRTTSLLGTSRTTNTAGPDLHLSTMQTPSRNSFVFIPQRLDHRDALQEFTASGWSMVRLFLHPITSKHMLMYKCNRRTVRRRLRSPKPQPSQATTCATRQLFLPPLLTTLLLPLHPFTFMLTTVANAGCRTLRPLRLVRGRGPVLSTVLLGVALRILLRGRRTLVLRGRALVLSTVSLLVALRALLRGYLRLGRARARSTAPIGSRVSL